MSIDFSTIPPYHPQANPTERTNKVTKTMLRTFLEDNHRRWDEHIFEFAFAINNAPHDSLSDESAKLSPFFLNYGKNSVVPNSEFSKATSSIEIQKTDPKFWLDRINRLGAYQDLIKRFLSKASAKQAKVYNRGRKRLGLKLVT